VRVARRIAARALPVTASDSQADGGADWASEVHLDLVPFSIRTTAARTSVDLASNRAVADIGVHGIGEVDTIGLARQAINFLRRKEKHLVVKQLELVCSRTLPDWRFR